MVTDLLVPRVCRGRGVEYGVEQKQHLPNTHPGAGPGDKRMNVFLYAYYTRGVVGVPGRTGVKKG